MTTSGSNTSFKLGKDAQKPIFKCSSKAATKHPFTILLIGKSTWTSLLTEALIDYHENNNITKIQVYKAISVESAVSTLPNIYADLVIIFIDIMKHDCLIDIESNLLTLEPILLCGRTVLVNPRRDLKRNDMEITYENIDSLKRKYNLLIIHGNIEDYLSRTFLARRIMVYSYKINKSGLPNLLQFSTTID